MKSTLISSARLNGQKAEDLAEVFLQKKGYNILNKRFRCQYGELDIVAQKNNLISFVEVKYRKDKSEALLSVVFSKRQKIIKTACEWITRFSHIYNPDDYRFDIISVDHIKQITHFPSAFYIEDDQWYA